MFVGIAAHPHHGPNVPVGGTQEQHTAVALIVVGSFVTTGVGLLRLLGTSPRQILGEFAVVVLALAGTCGSLAAVTGHVIVPRFVQRTGNEIDATIVQAVVTRDVILSSTLTQVMFGAWAIGVLSLSVWMMQSRLIGRMIGWYGIALGVILSLALVLGQVPITLHSVGLVVLVSGTWLITTGSALCVIRQVESPRGSDTASPEY